MEISIEDGDLRIMADIVGLDTVTRYRVERLQRAGWVQVYQCSSLMEAEAFAMAKVPGRISKVMSYYTKEGRIDVN